MLKKLAPLDLARVQGLVCGFIGLLLGVIYSLGGFVLDALVTLGWLSGEAFGTPGLSYGTFLAFGALPVMPLGLGLAGLVAGWLEGHIYELLRRLLGG